MSAQNSTTVDRRSFMKTVGAGAGAVAVGAGGDFSPGPSAVGEAEAIAPIVVAAGAAGATAVGWLLRDHGVLGQDDPADGLTPEVLRQEVYDTARTRQSTNASTFVDNQNIVSSGLENSLYSEGKLAAIEAINNGDSESDANTAAQDAAASHASTVKENFLDSWNESVNEIDNQISALQDHSDTSVSDVLQAIYHFDGSDQDPTDPQTGSTTDVTLPDGTTYTVQQLELVNAGGNTELWDPTFDLGNAGDDFWIVASHDGDSLEYLSYRDWENVWGTIETAQTNAENGLSTWVSNVYGEVQSGELDPGELLSSSDLANLAPEDQEGFNRAVTDLLALNIPVDLEREAEISLTSVSGTLYGMLAATGETTIQAGDTITPSSASEDYYLTYDVSEGHGEWTSYNQGIDGGTVTFTAEPHPETLYTINTTADETAEVVAGDFTEDSGSWTVDVSDQLENAITNIDSVEFFAESDETNMVTIKLTEEFTVESFTNQETDEDVSSVDYSEPSQAQDDTNYISEEEWNQREQEVQDLIDDYEENTGGGGGGSILPDLGTGGILGGGLAIVAAIWLAGQALGS